MKKKNNYPKDRKPAAEKPCPYCSEFFAARGLHRHILIVHQINITKVTQVIPSLITKEIEVIRRPITKVIGPAITKEVEINPPKITKEKEVIPTAITKVIHSPITKEIASNESKLSNSDSNLAKNEPKELLDREGGTMCYDTLEKCILAIYPEVARFLERYDIFYCFGKAELREEINSLSPKHPSISMRCYTGQYKLTVTIKADNYNYNHHPYARFWVKELKLQ